MDVRLIRLQHVLQIVPVSKSTWWDWVSKGKAPKPLKFGRCTCWNYAEIVDFTKNSMNQLLSATASWTEKCASTSQTKFSDNRIVATSFCEPPKVLFLIRLQKQIAKWRINQARAVRIAAYRGLSNINHALLQTIAHDLKSYVLPPEKDRIVRPREAVHITGRSLASQHRAKKAGKWVPVYRIGDNAVGYLLSDLLALNASRKIVTADSVSPVAVPKEGKLRGRKPKL